MDTSASGLESSAGKEMALVIHQTVIENLLSKFNTERDSSNTLHYESLIEKESQIDWASELITQFPELFSTQDQALVRFITNRIRKTEGSGLFLGCPLSNEKRELTGETLFWCPNGWPPGKYHWLASSRLGNRLRQDPGIADGLRTFFARLNDDDCVLTATNTTLDGPTTRACNLFQRNMLRFQPFPKSVDVKWLVSTIRDDSEAIGNGERPNDPNSETIPPTIWYLNCDDENENRDSLLMSLSDQVRVLWMRSGGNIHRLCQTFSKQNCGPVMMARHSSHSKKTQQSLADLGIVNWHLLSNPEQLEEATCDIDSHVKNFQILNLDQISETEGEFLNHWTRADRKPWPDLHEHNQYDSLFFADEHRIQKQLVANTLVRILACQRLMSSGFLIREKRRVVCFTEIPLTDFPSRRIFRPAHSRWDFEPYGISIRKSIIQGLGGQPIRYEFESEFQTKGTHTDEIPPIETKSNKPKESPLENSQHIVRIAKDSTIDWSLEKEWRVNGDIDLQKIGPDDARVFVDDLQTAKGLAPFSRWPIIVIGSATPDPNELGPKSGARKTR